MPYNKYQSDIRHLAEPEFGRAKRIRVWENGDIHNKCYEFYINPNRLRTWNAILSYITHAINPNFGAIRKLVCVKSKTAVGCFSELENNGKYIAVGMFNHIKFVKRGYKTVSEVELANKVKKNRNSIQCEEDAPEYRFLLETKKRNLTIIFILINGRTRQQPAKVVLTEKDLLAWDVVLEYISNILDVPDGIQYLCTIDGEPILHPDSLQHGNLYIGVPFNEKFDNKPHYAQIFKSYGHALDISLPTEQGSSFVPSKKATVKKHRVVEKPTESLHLNTSKLSPVQIINRAESHIIPPSGEVKNEHRNVNEMRRNRDNEQILSNKRSRSTPGQIMTKTENDKNSGNLASSSTKTMETQTSYIIHNSSVLIGSKRFLLIDSEEVRPSALAVDDEACEPGVCRECYSLDSITGATYETGKATVDDADANDDQVVSNKQIDGSMNISSEFTENGKEKEPGEKVLEITDALSDANGKLIDASSKNSSIVKENGAEQDDSELISITIKISKSNDTNKISPEGSAFNYLESKLNLDNNDIELVQNFKSNKESTEETIKNLDEECCIENNEEIEAIDACYNITRNSNHDSITERIDNIKGIIDEILFETYENALQTGGIIAGDKNVEDVINKIKSGISNESGSQISCDCGSKHNSKKEKHAKHNKIKENDISEETAKVYNEETINAAKISEFRETASSKVENSAKNFQGRKCSKSSSKNEDKKSFTTFSASKRSNNSDMRSSGGITAALSENNMYSNCKRIPSIHIRNRTDINFCDYSKTRKSTSNQERRNKIPQKSGDNNDNKSFSSLDETLSTSTDSKRRNKNETGGCFCPYGSKSMAHKNSKNKKDETGNASYINNKTFLYNTTMADVLGNPICEINGNTGITLESCHPCCSVISIDSIEDGTRS